MGKINILDSTVFNRIAAGEVVERPCSIVKELVENSIDANADIISIDVKDGGIGFIRIVDNGCGIDADDLEKAFLPHATSKIKNIDDLNAILTLGFRGEALTSIASVAKISVLTRTRNDEVGSFISIENGKILEKGERGCGFGTTVTVENLFKNIPARSKFLAKQSSEESVITDMVSRLIITNNTKSIKYSVNGKTIYQSSGGGLKKALYTVYGKNFIDNMASIEYIMPDITIEGYINKPYFTKPNRTYQTLIVNGRYVINSDIAFCVYNCYRDYLMKRQFPVFALAITVPPDMIDVNVHPNKLEVKFANAENLKKSLFKIIKRKIDEMTVVPKDIIMESNSSDIQHEIKKHIDVNNNAAISNFTNIFPAEIFPKPQSEINSSAAKDEGREFSERLKNIISTRAAENINAAESQYSLHNSLIVANSTESKSHDDLDNIFSKSFSDFRQKTILFDTYIVLEDANDILLIDQHAAHERLLYDKFVREYEAKQICSQTMLLPYIFDVNPIEDELLQNKINEINECGFTLSQLSNRTYSLSAVPLICANMKTKVFIEQILNGLNGIKYKKSDFVKDILMQAACKAAVKGEDRLNEVDINYLIEGFHAGNNTLLCPHGRPIVIKISKSEIEKWFKRTV